MKSMKLLIVAVSISVAPAISWADSTIWQKLRTESNLIVFVRHAYSSGENPLAWDETGNCRGEHRLTQKGKALAQKIGQELKNHGIKPFVISSPMCRCLETAKTAFGDTLLTAPELRETASADEARMEAFESTAKSLIVSNRGALPIVFVSHRPNIDQLTLGLIDEGDLLVGEISDTGDIEVLGKISIGL